MWKDVFPEYAVKQAFHEFNLERGDEQIVLSMQSDLVSRCLYSILKSALIHCLHNKRKFIQEVDIQVGLSLSIFPTHVAPSNCGSLLNSNIFPNIVNEHVLLCKHHISKNCNIQLEPEYKLSQDTYVKLQLLVESCIRGFVHLLIKQTNRQPANFRHFEIVMSKILGDPSYMNFELGYSPYVS